MSRMSERKEQAMNKENNKYDEFGFFNPFSVRDEEKDEEKSEDCISPTGTEGSEKE